MQSTRLSAGFLAFVGCTSASSHATSSPKAGGDDGGAVQLDAAGSDTAVMDAAPTLTPVALPNSDPGISFDDLRYAPVIKKVLAPAGRSGNLDLVDPMTLTVTPIGGFSASSNFAGGHSAGVTSADEGGGKLFAIDHETQSVRVIEPATGSMVASTKLAGAPDYVRWVESSSEIWVTEPGTGMEVLSLDASGAPVHAATIAVSGGPEAIVVDNTRGRVYTNSFTGKTYAVDIAKRAVVETWTNGCGISLGLALDEARGYVFVACQSGSIAIADGAHGGTKLGESMQGSGLDIISYNPTLHHLYVPGSTSADLSILGISMTGDVTILGTIATVQGSNEVTADEFGNAWVADSAGGQLLKVTDTYPATP
jgi:hypothetical protein